LLHGHLDDRHPGKREGRESRIAVFVAMERFFAKHLGGRVQEGLPAAIQKRLDAMTVNIKDVVASPAGEGQRKAAPPSAPSPAR
jgi:hypothetical protein